MGLASVTVFAADATVGSDQVGQVPAAGAAASDQLQTAPRTGATQAFVDSDASIVAGDVSVTATAVVRADSTVSLLSIAAFVGASVGRTSSRAAQNVQAFVGDRARLTLSGGLLLDADSTLKATPNIADLSVALGISVSVFEITSRLDGEVSAVIGNAARSARPKSPQGRGAQRTLGVG